MLDDKQVEKLQAEKEAVRNKIDDQKKRVVEKQQMLKDMRVLKAIKEQVAANKNYSNRKLLAKEAMFKRDNIVKGFNAQQQLKRHQQAIFVKSPDGKIQTKALTGAEIKEWHKETKRLQQAYRESLYIQDAIKNKEWTEKYIEEHHRSDWNKKDYVSPEKQAEYDKARDTLREKAGLEKKSGHVDIFQAQRNAQENNKVKEQQKQKVQSR